jgi:hypothetical protein
VNIFFFFFGKLLEVNLNSKEKKISRRTHLIIKYNLVVFQLLELDVHHSILRETQEET